MLEIYSVDELNNYWVTELNKHLKPINKEIIVFTSRFNLENYTGMYYFKYKLQNKFNPDLDNLIGKYLGNIIKHWAISTVEHTHRFYFSFNKEELKGLELNNILGINNEEITYWTNAD